jgi:hypothetical protein
MFIVKSEPGSDNVPPSGPMTAEARCSTRECADPHLTARALAPLSTNENELLTATSFACERAGLVEREKSPQAKRTIALAATANL